MKRFITDAAVVAIGLAGLALSHVVTSPASVAVPVTVADKAEGLRAAAEGYANALLRGEGLRVVAHLSDFCSDSEQGDAVYAAELVAPEAGGASLTVTSVAVDGERGSVSAYELSPGAPAALRALFSSSQGEAAYPWRWVDGRWYFQGGCGVAPSASQGPVRTATSVA